MHDPNAQIKHVIESYQVAVWEKNAQALLQLYAPDVRVFDTWEAWTYEGGEAWRQVIEKWFASLDDGRVKVRLNDVQITSEPASLALVTASISYVGISAEGQELRAIKERLTWVLRLEGNDWKIVHQHSSVPIGLHDSKAVFWRDAQELLESQEGVHS